MNLGDRLLRPVWVYGACLTLALTAAYLSWTAEPEDAGVDEVVVVEIDRKDLESVTYKSEALAVTVTPRTDEHGDYLWVDTDRTVTPPNKPATVGRHPPASAPAASGIWKKTPLVFARPTLARIIPREMRFRNKLSVRICLRH